jgi:predicted transcriptional regulator
MLTKLKTSHVSIRVEDELREALEVAAEQDRRPMASLIRCVLADWVASRPPVERRA